MAETSKNEIMIIQNELLGDIKNVEQKLNDKIKLVIHSLEDQKNNLEKKLSILEKGYNALVQREMPEENYNTSKEKEILTKINTLNKRLDESSSRLEIKINKLDENLKDAIYKYDRAISDNFIIPGLIGSKAPFPSLRDLLETTYKKSMESLKLKQVQAIDLKKYKEKMEIFMDNTRSDLKTLDIKLTKNFLAQLKYQEQLFNERININEERINNMRMENGKYTFDLMSKYNEVKDNCNKNNEHLKNTLDEYNKDFSVYKTTIKGFNSKFNGFEESYNAFKTEIKTINERCEENNKANSNLENKIKDLEKSIITTTKQSIRDYFEKNEKTAITKQNNNFSAYKEEDEKNSFLSNRLIKKIDINKIKFDKKNLLSKSYLKSTGYQISDENEENVKINSVLYDADFFGDSKQEGNTSNNELFNDTDRIKKAKMPHYRIRSGKILKHFPFISHDISNNEELINKMTKITDREKMDILKIYPEYIKKRRIEKEINFPYNNHKYKYLEKKIDILGKSMVNNFNKIILQINFLKKNNVTSNNPDLNQLNSKEKEDNDEINTTIIRSIKNSNINSPLYEKKFSSDMRSSGHNSLDKKVNLTKSKLNQKIKLVQSRENSSKNY